MKEDKFEEDVKEGEYGFLHNSDDEIVSYYENNMVKKFFSKLISGNFKHNLEKKLMSNVGESQKGDAKVKKKEE